MLLAKGVIYYGVCDACMCNTVYGVLSSPDRLFSRQTGRCLPGVDREGRLPELLAISPA